MPGEPHALGRQPVDVGGAQPLLPVTPQLSPAEIIGQDEHDVGPLRTFRAPRRCKPNAHQRQDPGPATQPPNHRVAPPSFGTVPDFWSFNSLGAITAWQ